MKYFYISIILFFIALSVKSQGFVLEEESISFEEVSDSAISLFNKHYAKTKVIDVTFYGYNNSYCINHIYSDSIMLKTTIYSEYNSFYTRQKISLSSLPIYIYQNIVHEKIDTCKGEISKIDLYIITTEKNYSFYEFSISYDLGEFKDENDGEYTTYVDFKYLFDLNGKLLPFIETKYY